MDSCRLGVGSAGARVGCWLGLRRAVVSALLAGALLSSLGQVGTARADSRSDAERAGELVARLRGAKEGPPAPEVALTRAETVLQRAARRAVPPSGSMKHSLLLGRNAWIWAQIARDTRRTVVAEGEAALLEKRASRLAADLVRTRAAVEQAKARVGRSKKDLAELQAAVSVSGGTGR